MFIYNVTLKVESAIAEAWLQWLRSEHIPEVLQTGCFTHHRVVKLLQIDEQDGPTYAVQYFTETLTSYESYIANHAPVLRQKTLEKWGDKFIAFRTLMEVI